MTWEISSERLDQLVLLGDLGLHPVGWTGIGDGPFQTMEMEPVIRCIRTERDTISKVYVRHGKVKSPRRCSAVGRE